VPVSSITKLYRLPQFYNVFDDEGNLKGKILARFFLMQKNSLR